MADNITEALTNWVGTFKKSMGGALFNEALTLAERAEAEAIRLCNAAAEAHAEGGDYPAKNALLTAAQLHLDAANYFERAAQLTTMGRMQYLEIAQANRASAQSAIEFMHEIEGTPAESTTSDGLAGLTADEASGYPILTENHAPGVMDQVPKVGDVYSYAKSVDGEITYDEDGTEVWNLEVEKGDVPGHEFHGNQYATAQANAAVSKLMAQVREHDKKARFNKPSYRGSNWNGKYNHQVNSEFKKALADKISQSPGKPLSEHLAEMKADWAKGADRRLANMQSDYFDPRDSATRDAVEDATKILEPLARQEDAERNAQNIQSGKETDSPKDSEPERRDYKSASDAAHDAVSKASDPSKVAEVSSIHQALARYHDTKFALAKQAGNESDAKAHYNASVAHSEASVDVSPEASQKAAEATDRAEHIVDLSGYFGTAAPVSNVSKGDVMGHPFHGNQYGEGQGESADVAGKNLAEKAENLHKDSVSGGSNGDYFPDIEHINIANDHHNKATECRAVGDEAGARAHEKAADAHEAAAIAADKAIRSNIDNQEGRVSDAKADKDHDAWMKRSDEARKASARAEKASPTENFQLSKKSASMVMNAVVENGGATISKAGKTPTTGYIVATDPMLGKVVSGSVLRDADKFKQTLGDYIEANQKELADGSKFLGLWHNTANGADELHLDVVEKIDDKDEAIKAGQDRNQMAIWDLANSQEIETGGTGSEHDEEMG